MGRRSMKPTSPACNRVTGFVFVGADMMDMDSRAAFYTGFVMGQINKNMEAHVVARILYEAFTDAIKEAKKDASS